MKKYFSFLLLAISPLLLKAQQYHNLLTKDAVEVEYSFNNREEMLYLKLTNNGSQKVYAGPDYVLWFNGPTQVAKQNGGGVTLQPGESSSFGMFWNYPKGYKQGYTFKLDNFKVEIGGQGKDPRYNSSSTTSGTKNSSAPLREIVFSDEDPKPEKPLISQVEENKTKKINNSNPDNSAKVDNNIKLNGLYYSNGTANPNNTTSNNTVNTDQKQKYQNQANDYLNKAQDNNQSVISKQTNLDLAKINAIAAGNPQQAQQIQEMQRQQTTANNEAIGSGITALFSIIGNIGSNKRQYNIEKQQREREELSNLTLEAEKGNVEAAYKLGDHFHYFTKKGDQLALKWYTIAAEGGHVLAMYKVGLFHFLGYGTKKDHETSFFWEKKAAENGHLNGLESMGNYYSRSENCEERKIALGYYLVLDTLNYSSEIKFGSGISSYKIPEIQKKIGDILINCGDLRFTKKQTLEYAVHFYSKSLRTIEDFEKNSKYKDKVYRNGFNSLKKEIAFSLKEVEKAKNEVENKLAQ